ncbi:FAD-dependent oxidoreductase [Streptomyces sp. ISL-14]|nr:FAD-dependent oxidoreductase [Streptomyces sp. ISL-14]
MTQSPPSSVLVVGGGVVGLACAHYLGRAGLTVTVLERDRLGSGASRGNAGEICPDRVEPLGAPGVAVKALTGVFRPDSPLWINPVPSIPLLRFLAGLRLRSTARHHGTGAAALAALAEDTFALFEELEALGVDGGAGKDGFLFAYPSYEDAAHGLAGFRRLGAPVAPEGVLRGAAQAGTEPALGPAARAGFLVERQWAVDPGQLMDTLAERLRRDGAELVEGARVTAVRDGAGRVEVRTSAGTCQADAVVIAAGVWSRQVCASLGVRIDVATGKGYSFSVPAESLPRRLVHLGSAKAVPAPLGKGVRVAGTMEFDRDPDRFRQGRVEALVAAARPYLPGADWERREQEWMGPRPMTPDGLPLIGPLPGRPRVLLATGHNMLGRDAGPGDGTAGRRAADGGGGPGPAARFAPGRSVGPAPSGSALGAQAEQRHLQGERRLLGEGGRLLPAARVGGRDGAQALYALGRPLRVRRGEGQGHAPPVGQRGFELARVVRLHGNSLPSRPMKIALRHGGRMSRRDGSH